MKIILFAIITAALTFAGCGEASKSNGDIHDHGDGSTHSHDNGEIHQHHDTVQQQEFTVDPDSTILEHHDHAGDSAHSHSH